MRDEVETKKQFVEKIKLLQRRIVEFEKLESERKKSENVLRASERKFQDLIEATTDWIWEVDKEGVYVYVSPKVKELLGYEASDILGKTLFDFMPREEAKKASNVFKKNVIHKELFYGLEKVYHHKDGHLVILETSGVPIFDEEGRLRGYRGIDRDITKRKKAEMMLKISESTLKQQKLALEQKNAALKEVIEHIEREKNKIKDDIAINVGEVLLPLLNRLGLKGTSHKYVNLLKYHLEELTSSFGRKITEKSKKLTPREIEICSMIKGGLTSKEASELLNISYQTIVKHRKHIRKKLGISSNKDVNLVSFLQRI